MPIFLRAAVARMLRPAPGEGRADEPWPLKRWSATIETRVATARLTLIHIEAAVGEVGGVNRAGVHLQQRKAGHASVGRPEVEKATLHCGEEAALRCTQLGRAGMGPPHLDDLGGGSLLLQHRKVVRHQARLLGVFHHVGKHDRGVGCRRGGGGGGVHAGVGREGFGVLEGASVEHTDEHAARPRCRLPPQPPPPPRWRSPLAPPIVSLMSHTLGSTPSASEMMPLNCAQRSSGGGSSSGGGQCTPVG